MTALPRALPYYRVPTGEQIGKSLVADHLAEVAALADPRPSTVTLAHFMRRDMNADLAAGRCTVTCAHRLFHSAPRLVVKQIRFLPNNGRPYILVTADGREWQTHSGLEQLAVTWHDVPDGWDDLSMPMKYALRHLAGDYPRAPRWNTLRALQTRGLAAGGQITPSGRTLYQAHQQEFADG